MGLLLKTCPFSPNLQSLHHSVALGSLLRRAFQSTQKIGYLNEAISATRDSINTADSCHTTCRAYFSPINPAQIAMSRRRLLSTHPNLPHPTTADYSLPGSHDQLLHVNGRQLHAALDTSLPRPRMTMPCRRCKPLSHLLLHLTNSIPGSSQCKVWTRHLGPRDSLHDFQLDATRHVTRRRLRNHASTPRPLPPLPRSIPSPRSPLSRHLNLCCRRHADPSPSPGRHHKRAPSIAVNPRRVRSARHLASQTLFGPTPSPETHLAVCRTISLSFCMFLCLSFVLDFPLLVTSRSLLRA